MNSLKPNIDIYLALKKYQRDGVIIARTSHLDSGIMERILNNPDLLLESVPADYCGEDFLADLEKDIGENSSEESREIYRKAYLRGYNRGFERFEAQCFGGVIRGDEMRF
ncbi:hypothetical protein NIES4101_83460 [Calothrix sp. NIES-4101]|nr:hypothetical protein NIES4101_83460 [Calothrix sp. NIES-4101]